MTINYEADYERGKAQETFVFTMNGGKATLRGYNINSEALILN